MSIEVDKEDFDGERRNCLSAGTGVPMRVLSAEDEEMRLKSQLPFGGNRCSDGLVFTSFRG